MWLLNYIATNPDASITYIASDMCLLTHSDASYLSVPKVQSRDGGYFFLSNKSQPDKPISEFTLNGPVHIINKTLKFVMESTAEAEIGAAHIVG